MRRYIITVILLSVIITFASLPAACPSWNPILSLTPHTTTIDISITGSTGDWAVARQVGMTWVYWNVSTNSWSTGLSTDNVISVDSVTVTGLVGSSYYRFKAIDMSSFPVTCSGTSIFTAVTGGPHKPIWLKGDSLIIYQKSRFGRGIYFFDLGDGDDALERTGSDPSFTTDNIGTCNRPADSIFTYTLMLKDLIDSTCYTANSPQVSSEYDSSWICLSSCEECTTCGYEYIYWFWFYNSDMSVKDSFSIRTPVIDTCSCAPEPPPSICDRMCFIQHGDTICYNLCDTMTIMTDSLYVTWDGKWITHLDTISTPPSLPVDTCIHNDSLMIVCDTICDSIQVCDSFLLDECYYWGSWTAHWTDSRCDSFYNSGDYTVLCCQIYTEGCPETTWTCDSVYIGYPSPTVCDTIWYTQHDTTEFTTLRDSLNIMSDSLYINWSDRWVTHLDTIYNPTVTPITVDTSVWCWYHTADTSYGAPSMFVYDEYRYLPSYRENTPYTYQSLRYGGVYEVYFDEFTSNIKDFLDSASTEYIITNGGCIASCKQLDSADVPSIEGIKGLAPWHPIVDTSIGDAVDTTDTFELFAIGSPNIDTSEIIKQMGNVYIFQMKRFPDEVSEYLQSNTISLSRYHKPEVFTAPYSFCPDTSSFYVHKFDSALAMTSGNMSFGIADWICNICDTPSCFSASNYVEENATNLWYTNGGGSVVYSTHGDGVYCIIGDMLGGNVDSVNLENMIQDIYYSGDSLPGWIEDVDFPINFSWGVPRATSGSWSHLYDYIDTTEKIIVWAGGNGGPGSTSDPQYSSKNAIVVSGLDYDPATGDFIVASFNGDPFVDLGFGERRLYHTISALGMGCATIQKDLTDSTAGNTCNWEIDTTNAVCVVDSCNNTYGTSFAAPVVTAALALIRENLTVTGHNGLLYSILINSADYEDDRPSKWFGYGVLNAAEGVYEAQNSNHYSYNTCKIDTAIRYKVYSRDDTIKVTNFWFDPYLGLEVTRDLDIKLITYSNDTIYPWMFNSTSDFAQKGPQHNSNIEQIYATDLDSAILYVTNYNETETFEFYIASLGSLGTLSDTADTGLPPSPDSACTSCGLRYDIDFGSGANMIIYPPDLCIGGGSEVIYCSFVGTATGSVWVCDTIYNPSDSLDIYFIVDDSCNGTTYQVNNHGTIYLHNCGGGGGPSTDHRLFHSYRVERENTNGSADYYGSSAIGSVIDLSDTDYIHIKIAPGTYDDLTLTNTEEHVTLQGTSREGCRIPYISSAAESLIIQNMTIDTISGCGYIRLEGSDVGKLGAARTDVIHSSVEELALSDSNAYGFIKDSDIGKIIYEQLICAGGQLTGCGSDTAKIILTLDGTAQSYSYWFSAANGARILSILKQLNSYLSTTYNYIYWYPIVYMGDDTPFRKALSSKAMYPVGIFNGVNYFGNLDVPSTYNYSDYSYTINTNFMSFKQCSSYVDIICRRSSDSHRPDWGTALRFARNVLKGQHPNACGYIINLWDADFHHIHDAYNDDPDANSYPIVVPSPTWRVEDTIYNVPGYRTTGSNCFYNPDSFRIFCDSLNSAYLLFILNGYTIREDSSQVYFEQVDSLMSKAFGERPGVYGLLDSIWKDVYGDFPENNLYYDTVSAVTITNELISSIPPGGGDTTETPVNGELYLLESSIGSLSTNDTFDIKVYSDNSAINYIEYPCSIMITQTSIGPDSLTPLPGNRWFDSHNYIVSPKITISSSQNISQFSDNNMEYNFEGSSPTESLTVQSGYDVGIWSNKSEIITSPLDSMDEHNYHEHGIKDNTYYNWLQNSDFDEWDIVNTCARDSFYHIEQPTNWVGGILGCGLDFNTTTDIGIAPYFYKPACCSTAGLAAYGNTIVQAIPPSSIVQNDSFVISFVPLVGEIDTCIRNSSSGTMRQPTLQNSKNIPDTLIIYTMLDSASASAYSSNYTFIIRNHYGGLNIFDTTINITNWNKRYYIKGYWGSKDTLLEDPIDVMIHTDTLVSGYCTPEFLCGIDMVQISTGPLIRKYSLNEPYISIPGSSPASFIVCDSVTVTEGDTIPSCATDSLFVYWCDSVLAFGPGDTLKLPDCSYDTLYFGDTCSECCDSTWVCCGTELKCKPDSVGLLYGNTISWNDAQLLYGAEVGSQGCTHDYRIGITDLVRDTSFNSYSDSMIIVWFDKPTGCESSFITEANIHIHMDYENDIVYIYDPMWTKLYYVGTGFNDIDLNWVYDATVSSINAGWWIVFRPDTDMTDWSEDSFLCSATISYKTWNKIPCADTIIYKLPGDTIYTVNCQPPTTCSIFEQEWNAPELAWSQITRDYTFSCPSGITTLHQDFDIPDYRVFIRCDSLDTNGEWYYVGDTVTLTTCDSVGVAPCGDTIWFHNGDVIPDTIFWCYNDSLVFWHTWGDSIDAIYNLDTISQLGFIAEITSCDSVDTLIDSIMVNPYGQILDTIHVTASCDTCMDTLCVRYYYRGDTGVQDTVICGSPCEGDTLGSFAIGPRNVTKGNTILLTDTLESDSTYIIANKDTIAITSNNNLLKWIYNNGVVVDDTLVIQDGNVLSLVGQTDKDTFDISAMNSRLVIKPRAGKPVIIGRNNNTSLHVDYKALYYGNNITLGGTYGFAFGSDLVNAENYSFLIGVDDTLNQDSTFQSAYPYNIFNGSVLFNLPEGYHLGGDSIVIFGGQDTIATPIIGTAFIDTTGGDTLKVYLNSAWEVH